MISWRKYRLKQEIAMAHEKTLYICIFFFVIKWDDLKSVSLAPCTSGHHHNALALTIVLLRKLFSERTISEAMHRGNDPNANGLDKYTQGLDFRPTMGGGSGKFHQLRQ